MRVLLIDNGTKHLDDLKRLLLGHKIDIYELFSKYPSTFGYNLIVLSGGSKIAIKDSPSSFANEIELIKNSKTPIIGICEGCELIAYAYNSDIEKTTPKVKGIKEIEIIKNNYFTLPSPINVYEAHHWAIKRLGRKLTGLARSRTGFEIIKHKSKPIYGFQFHPEMFVDKLVGDDMFNQVLSKIK